MLSPLRTPTSYIYTSAEKLTSVDEQPHPLDPDFFKPIATESGVSCTYSKEFYNVFSDSADPSQHSLCKLALLVLGYMTLDDKARLPLFKGASVRYVEQVLPAIQEKLYSEDVDDETLLTKFHIMNCVGQFGCLQSKEIFTGSDLPCKKVRLRSLSLMGVNLSGLILNNADLEASDLTGAVLAGTFLRNAKLTGTNLTEAYLGYAVLTHANLTGANLTGANITGANLTRANLTRTNLAGAICDFPIKLSGTSFKKTTWISKA